MLCEPLGIILLQKTGYFKSYQSLPFQFTLIAGDQSKQRKLLQRPCPIFINFRYMRTDSCKNSTVYNAYNVRLVRMVCLVQNCVWIVSFASFVSMNQAFASFLLCRLLRFCLYLSYKELNKYIFTSLVRYKKVGYH